MCVVIWLIFEDFDLLTSVFWSLVQLSWNQFFFLLVCYKSSQEDKVSFFNLPCLPCPSTKLCWSVCCKNRLELYGTQISTISFLEPGPGQKSNISNVIYMQKGQKVCKSLLYIPLCFRPNWISAQPKDRLFYAQKWDSSLREESAQNH
jgi:hypothetical protein